MVELQQAIPVCGKSSKNNKT